MHLYKQQTQFHFGTLLCFSNFTICSAKQSSLLEILDDKVLYNAYVSLNRTIHPMPCKNSDTDFSPRDICWHKVFSFCCSCLVSLRTRFLVGSPCLALSSSVKTFIWSFWIHWIVCHSPGFLWPTR